MLPSFLKLLKKKYNYLYIALKHYNTKPKKKTKQKQKQINKKEHYCTRKACVMSLVLLITGFLIGFHHFLY